jgi:Predicted membrane protein (DUF2254)
VARALAGRSSVDSGSSRSSVEELAREHTARDTVTADFRRPLALALRRAGQNLPVAGIGDRWTALRRRWRRAALYARFLLRRLARTLRYRFRLQRGEYPPPAMAFPPLVDEPAPLFAAAQGAVGRALGRGYLLFDRLREHFRIERSRLRDRLGGPRLTLVLVRQQVGLLLIVLALIVGGLGADVLVTRYGRHLAGLPGGHFLARHLTGPSAATLDSALTATATATGAVLGLVLTISLITFQTTAARYRSDRIVGFLVREQVGSVVVRLLAAGFLFSLWLLFLRDVVTGYPPYVSTALAVAVTTSGIGSLIVYRLHALLGLAPANVFRARRSSSCTAMSSSWPGRRRSGMSSTARSTPPTRSRPRRRSSPRRRKASSSCLGSPSTTSPTGSPPRPRASSLASRGRTRRCAGCRGRRSCSPTSSDARSARSWR